MGRNQGFFERWIVGSATIALAMIAGCSSTPSQQTESAPPIAQAGAGSHNLSGDVDHAPSSVSTADALRKLKDGNARYASGKVTDPNRSSARRTEVAGGQHPYAIVLSCSDSRVPPELIFDAGLGDIFVVRVAGNTADDTAIGSIEYAVEHLGAPLILVLGHSRCGAVKAAVDSVGSHEPAPGHLQAVVAPIMPAAEQAKQQGGDVLPLAIRDNVANVVEQLRQSKPLLADRVKSGKLEIIGGVYNLDSGQVEFDNAK